MDMSENDVKKQFLRGYINLGLKLKRYEAQLDEVRQSKLSLGIVNDGMPHSSGGAVDLSGYMAKVDELERDIVQIRYHRICEFHKIQTLIEQMEDEQEKLLLTYRYLRDYNFDRIAEEMGYTYRHVIRIHGRALENFKMS